MSSAEYIRRFVSNSTCNQLPAVTTRHFTSATAVMPTRTSVTTTTPRAEPLSSYASLSDHEHRPSVDSHTSLGRYKNPNYQETNEDDVIRALRNVSFNGIAVSGLQKPNLAVTRPRSVSEDLSLTRGITNNHLGGFSTPSSSFPETSFLPRSFCQKGESQESSNQTGRPILGAQIGFGVEYSRQNEVASQLSRQNDFTFSRQNFDAPNVSRQNMLNDENEPFRPIALPVHPPARRPFDALENLANNRRPLLPKTELAASTSALDSFKTAPAVSNYDNCRWSINDDKENWVSAANSGLRLQDTDVFSSYDRFFLEEDKKNRFTAVMSTDNRACDEVFSTSAETSTSSLEDSCDRCMRELMGMSSAGSLNPVSKPVRVFESDSARYYNQVKVIEILIFLICHYTCIGILVICTQEQLIYFLIQQCI